MRGLRRRQMLALAVAAAAINCPGGVRIHLQSDTRRSTSGRWIALVLLDGRGSRGFRLARTLNRAPRGDNWALCACGRKRMALSCSRRLH
jgi:hypothetical protein